MVGCCLVVRPLAALASSDEATEVGVVLLDQGEPWGHSVYSALISASAPWCLLVCQLKAHWSQAGGHG